MIKVQATINGVISKSGTIRMAGDGKKFIGFPVKLTVPGSRNNMPGKELTVSVSKDGDESELSSLMVDAHRGYRHAHFQKDRRQSLF